MRRKPSGDEADLRAVAPGQTLRLDVPGWLGG
jgi:hypothetical protein